MRDVGPSPRKVTTRNCSIPHLLLELQAIWSIMSDTAEESLAQRQARLRREKRNAKIQSGGADRLAKITGVSGRSAPAPEDGTNYQSIVITS